MLGSVDDGVPVLDTKSGRRRRLLMPLFVAIIVGIIAVIMVNSGRQTEVIGAGSTLAQPLIVQSATAFRNAQAADNPDRPTQTGNDWVLSGQGISYEPVGSLGGIMRLSEPDVDFAIADYPLSAEALTERDAVQFPIAAGAIAVAHNLDIPDNTPLRLDAATLSAIYRGDITSWNDPALVALNPDLALPELAIDPIHRSDGSGSTYGFTSYLAAGDPDWVLGTATTLTWPTGTGVERSSGLLTALAERPGAIGYVEAGQSARAGLHTVELLNAGGAFTGPTPAAMSAAVSDVAWSADDNFASSVPEVTDPAAYPMTVAIYAMLRREQTSDTTRTLAYLNYLLDRYDTEASDLGYLPLPTAAVTAVHGYWQDLFDYRAV